MKLPENTANKLYIQLNYSWEPISFTELYEKIYEHFGKDIDMSKLTISPQHIQIDCFGYDRYDSGDWSDFLVIERSE